MNALLLVAAVVAAPSAAQAQGSGAEQFVPSDTLCRIGAYRSPGGELVSITRREKGYRYVFLDGRAGYLADPNPLVICTREGLDVKRDDGRIEKWAQVPLRHTRTRFPSDGVTLSGLLIEPVSVKGKPPLVVFVHGSNNTGWINGSFQDAYLMAASGISAFLFDKRGTGESTGSYNQNFRLLAKDIVAGAAEARRLAAGRYGKFGLIGLSQGGWIGPLAAGPARADFLVINYGGIFTPLEEDFEQVVLDVLQTGVDAQTAAKAREVAEAAGEVVASGFTSGYERLAEMRRKYGQEPWFKAIKGEFSGRVLAATEAELRALAGKPDPLGLDWRFDSRPVLQALDIPILWILAEKDRESPYSLTAGRIGELQQAGKPITFYSFPDTDHGMWEFTEAPNGTRTLTRYTDGYFRLVADWVTGRTSPSYGRATLRGTGGQQPK
ncbi:MAG TPA: alpha/beta hydrolase [Myxococcaceae bacterium]